MTAKDPGRSPQPCGLVARHVCGGARHRIALGALVFASACTGTIGDSPTPQTTPGSPGSPGLAGNSTTTACDASKLLSKRLVRLASSELRDHVRASLPGVDEALVQGIDLQAGHVTPIVERVISSADFAAYYAAALSVAEAYATKSSEAEACRTGSADACLNKVVSTAVARLYRRAAIAQEWTPIADSFERLLAAQGAVRAAAGVVATALLAPQTLFRAELSDDVSNGAARLSRTVALESAAFAFTGRAPTSDETKTLGALRDDEFPVALSKLAASWTQAPEFRGRALDFAEVRFGVDRMPELTRSDAAFSPDVRAGLTAEFREYVGETLLSTGGTFAALFTGSPSHVFPGLEGIYGAGGSARRKGVLGLASLLTARAAPDGSDPVKRGLTVRVDLLCESVPPPIAGATFDKVMVTPDMQTRERFEALASVPVCGGCHKTINPPGYLFEEFDQVGRHRDTEKGRPINAVGTLPPPFGGQAYPGVGTWDGMVPLADWMSTAPEARRCFAAHFTSYVMSEPIPDGVANCMLPAIASRFVQSGRVEELAADLVQSELFLDRSQEAP